MHVSAPTPGTDRNVCREGFQPIAGAAHVQHLPGGAAWSGLCVAWGLRACILQDLRRAALQPARGRGRP